LACAFLVERVFEGQKKRLYITAVASTHTIKVSAPGSQGRHDVSTGSGRGVGADATLLSVANSPRRRRGGRACHGPVRFSKPHTPNPRHRSLTKPSKRLNSESWRRPSGGRSRRIHGASKMSSPTLRSGNVRCELLDWTSVPRQQRSEVPDWMSATRQHSGADAGGGWLEESTIGRGTSSDPHAQALFGTRVPEDGLYLAGQHRQRSLLFPQRPGRHLTAHQSGESRKVTCYQV
jgi:hypothetical protein